MLVSGIGVCKRGVLCHAQIMTSDAAHVWLGDGDEGFDTLANSVVQSKHPPAV
jgi:hypothetical protein